ncbi:MAG TPA: hypothetical protein VGN16_21805 [Acidobacteriaceae bacterium]|jgi:hypothetical protein
MTIMGFKLHVVALQAIIFSIPLATRLVEGDSAMFFPPMGDHSGGFRFFAMLLIGAAVIIPFALPIQKRRFWIITGALLGLVVSTFAYLTLEQVYVVPLHHYTKHGEQIDDVMTFVIRGSERVPTLKEPYASMTDADVIRHSGEKDERLEHVYTKMSLWANRMKLFLTYVFSLIFLQIFVGVVASTDQKKAAKRKSAAKPKAADPSKRQRSMPNRALSVDATLPTNEQCGAISNSLRFPASLPVCARLWRTLPSAREPMLLRQRADFGKVVEAHQQNR